jgi:hypothetical protein
MNVNELKGIEMCLKSKKATLLEPIAQPNSITGGDKEKQDGIKAVLSNSVGATGQISNLLMQELKVLGEFINQNERLIGIADYL